MKINIGQCEWGFGMFKKEKYGQTTVEYALLLIVIMGAFLTVQNYMKRGIQGRWKESVDSLGDQYDPRTANTDIRHIISSSTNTTIMALNTDGGFWTKRTDVSSSAEQKVGSTTVGAF